MFGDILPSFMLFSALFTRCWPASGFLRADCLGVEAHREPGFCVATNWAVEENVSALNTLKAPV